MSNKQNINKTEFGLKQLYKIQSSESETRTSLIIDSNNNTFQVPFYIEPGTKEIELVKRKRENEITEYSLINNDYYGYSLNQIRSFKINSLEEREENGIKKYYVRVKNEKEQVFVFNCKKIDYLNLRENDEIKCRIKKIYPKKIFLSLEENKLNRFLPEKEYTFNVINSELTTNRKDLAILNVEYKNQIFELTVPFWQHYYKVETIKCKVSREGKLIQSFSETDHPYFEIGKTYQFTFLQTKESTSNIIIAKGNDNCIYSVTKPFIYHQKEIPQQHILKLVYKGLNKESGAILAKFFIPFEEIIQDFRALKRITFDAFRKENNEDGNLVESFIISKLYKDYDNLENIWVISFCEVLRIKINKTLIERDIEASLIFIDVLIKFEKWILNSGFLYTFSADKREKTIKAALFEINAFTNEAKALEILLDGIETEFTNKLIEELKEKKTDQEILNKCFVFFNLMKHEFIETSILNTNKYLEILYLIGTKGIYSKEIELFQSVNTQLERIKNIFEKKLFHHVYINSEKRNNYYVGNKELLKYIKYTYLTIIINCEFKSENHVYTAIMRFFKIRGLYLSEERNQKNNISTTLKLLKLNSNEVFDKAINTIKWSLEENKIFEWNIEVNQPKELKNILTLKDSLLNSKPIEARVIGNSLLGYELKYKEDSIILPFINSYKKFKRGENISCIIYQIDNEFGQALARTNLDISKIPINQTIELGSVVKGIVKRIESFGAFIYLGNTDGLIPFNEVSNNYLKKIEDILEIGDIVEVQVINIEKEGDIERISLSRKAAINLRDPEKLTTKNYKAKITSVHESYGIFLELENGQSGLIRPDEISWNEYDSIINQYSEGENIEVLYTSSKENKNYFSLKRNIKDPFTIKLDSKKIYKAKILGILDFSKWLDQFKGVLKPILNSEGDNFCYCPNCYEKSLYRRLPIEKSSNTRTLFKKVDENHWSCSNCGLYQQEVIQFLIPELFCNTEWALQNLPKRDYTKVIRLLNKNDELDLEIKKIDHKRRKFVVDVNIKSVRKSTLQTEIKSFEKNISQEAAGSYEAYGFLENDLEKKWNYLLWAKYYYAGSKSAKSYYLNVYINYIKILNSIIAKDSLLTIDENIEKIKTFISDIELESNSIEVFPVIEKIITLLKVLSQFKSKSEDALKYLLSVVIIESEEHDYVKELASTILSYNLQKSDSIDLINNLENRILSVLRSSLKSFESLETDNNQTKMRSFTQKLIQNGEKNNVEFKASLQTPVLSKTTKKEIKNIKSELLKDIKKEEKDLFTENLLKLTNININDKFLIEKVNLSAMKTIAAFANTTGGYLIIGVDEDENGETIIEGLNPDYTKLKNRDGILLRLDELIQKYFGNSFNNILLEKVEFIVLQNKEVLLLTINKSEKPIFLNHNNEKRFYIRRQASTVELTAFELYEFISNKQNMIPIIG